MNREIHVRFWEGLGVRFPRATHLFCSGCDGIDEDQKLDQKSPRTVVISSQQLFQFATLEIVESSERNEPLHHLLRS